MLNSAERPPRRFMAAAALELYGSTNRYPIDDITLDRFPKRAEHSKLHKSVKPAASSVGMSSTNDERLKRIMREVSVYVGTYVLHAVYSSSFVRSKHSLQILILRSTYT